MRNLVRVDTENSILETCFDLCKLHKMILDIYRKIASKGPQKQPNTPQKQDICLHNSQSIA